MTREAFLEIRKVILRDYDSGVLSLNTACSYLMQIAEPSKED